MEFLFFHIWIYLFIHEFLWDTSFLIGNGEDAKGMLRCPGASSDPRPLFCTLSIYLLYFEFKNITIGYCLLRISIIFFVLHSFFHLS